MWEGKSNPIGAREARNAKSSRCGGERDRGPYSRTCIVVVAGKAIRRSGRGQFVVTRLGGQGQGKSTPGAWPEPALHLRPTLEGDRGGFPLQVVRLCLCPMQGCNYEYAQFPVAVPQVPSMDLQIERY